MTPDSDVSPWLTTLRAAGRSPRTIEGYADSLDRLERFLGRDALSATRLVACGSCSRCRRRSPRPAVSHHHRAVRAFLGWFAREELLDKNPADNLRLSVPETIKSTPTVEQVDAVLSAARQDRRASAILTVLADTGCRRGELAAVTRADVDLTSGVLRLPVSKTRARMRPVVRPGAGRPRAVDAPAAWRARVAGASVAVVTR